MRKNIFAVSLLFLAFPALTHASNPPTLATYTVSDTTIYPSDNSGLATTTTIDISFSEQVKAKASIEITSADGTVIKNLYSSSGTVTNPAAKIWNGTNDAGTRVNDGVYTILISATSVATNLTMTDSSKTITVASVHSATDSDDGSSNSNNATTTAVVLSAGTGGPTEFLPIPTLRIITGGDRTISSNADTAFTAVVYDNKGNKRDDAIISWSFGDGMKKTGASVFHSYYDQGEYVAVVHAVTSDGGDALAEIKVMVKDASIKIVSVSARGVTLSNGSQRTLDLSLWRLSSGGQEFKIPENTEILAGHTILFPTQVIELPSANSAELLYPSGEVAASYPVGAEMKLSSASVSINTMQAASPIISGKNTKKNDEAVNAPAAATELAAAGAALPQPTSSEEKTPPVSGVFHSPWTLGLLGVIVAAGGAFILL